jgi:hypothetical protein
MTRRFFLLLALALTFTPTLRAEEAGFKSLFDGKTLEGWIPSELCNHDTYQPLDKKNEKWNGGGFWSVEDGCITARSTAENPCKENNFLMWRGGQVDDFELKLKFKIQGQPVANSGVQFRSQIFPNGHVGGYQADIDKGGKYVGCIYDDLGRKMLAARGQRSTVADGAKITGEKIADADELFKAINADDWNEYHITAVGNKMTTRINGKVMAEVIDNDRKDRDFFGVIALQIHSGPPMVVQFKDIYLKRLPLSDGRKRIVMIAGKPSHPPGAHEHNAGIWLHSTLLNQTMGDKLVASPYYNGWPTDPTAFDTADAVVMYSDGGPKHMIMDHLSEVDALHKKGVGVGVIHYATEPVLGESQARFLDWVGGAFEVNYSVNPHWDADYKQLPNHPITRGVKPFTTRDEWYFNIRFREGMKGVTGILSAVPGDEAYTRKDGPHEGNPDMRSKKGQPTITMWASEPLTPGAGRGFGFTGGHFHENWANDEQRKLVENAICWIAGVEVPANGVVTQLAPDMIKKNLDDKPTPQPRKNAPKK